MVYCGRFKAKPDLGQTSPATGSDVYTVVKVVHLAGGGRVTAEGTRE